MKKTHLLGLSTVLLTSLISLPVQAAEVSTISSSTANTATTAPAAMPATNSQDGLGGLAALLQMDPADLRTALASGQKLNTIAANHGVSQSQLNEYFANQKNNILSSAGRRSINGHVIKVRIKTKIKKTVKTISKKNLRKSHPITPKKPIRLARPAR